MTAYIVGLMPLGCSSALKFSGGSVDDLRNHLRQIPEHHTL